MNRLALTLTLLLGGAALAQTAPATTPAAPAQTAPAQTAPVSTPAAPAAPASTQDPAAVVARIGGETVTLGEFDRDFRQAVARVVNGQGAPFEESLLEEFAPARADYLKQYVRERATYQLARVANKPDAAALDAQVAQARAGFPTDAAFAEALGQRGYANVADFRAALERQTVVRAYLDTLQKRFTFGDSVVSGFYNLNRASFGRPGEACVKHILVPTKAEADAVTAQLAAGGDFAKIAQEKSQDPGSAAQGGDLGCINSGDTVAAFDQASFSGPLNVPQTVQTEFGWHVLIVTKRTQAGTLPLAEAAPLIRQQLAGEAAQKYLDAQIARLAPQSFPEVVTVAAATAPTPAPSQP
ncbi:peptidylprolyl isomerase [Deinococcus petrolearius]|uniref:Peptidylprolyl isomerase n=1 Tax=Deinococcus petrolearius TaxID=1751295 RepID=A0ABW1DK76_9DEIO